MNKKAQEEMVGFVLVMVVVAVIFLVFLGILANRDSPDQASSTEVSQFLDSFSEFTTDCSLDSGFSYKRMDDLASNCNQGLLCSSGKKACEVFEETAKKLIESTWQFSPESRTLKYEFKAEFSAALEISFSSDQDDSVACPNKRGADKTFSDVTLTLILCTAD